MWTSSDRSKLFGGLVLASTLLSGVFAQQPISSPSLPLSTSYTSAPGPTSPTPVANPHSRAKARLSPYAAEILKLKTAGVSTAVQKSFAESCVGATPPSADDLIQLHHAAVDESVIRAMLETGTKRAQARIEAQRLRQQAAAATATPIAPSAPAQSIPPVVVVQQPQPVTVVNTPTVYYDSYVSPWYYSTWWAPAYASYAWRAPYRNWGGYPSYAWHRHPGYRGHYWGGRPGHSGGGHVVNHYSGQGNVFRPRTMSAVNMGRPRR